MAKIPLKPAAGEKVLQSFYDSISEIIDYLPSLEIRGDNKTIRVNNSKFGKTITAIQKPSGAGGSGGTTTINATGSILAKTTEDSTGLNIKVKLYENGPTGSPSTETYNLFIPNLSIYGAIPGDTWIMANPINLTVIGGSDQ